MNICPPQERTTEKKYFAIHGAPRTDDHLHTLLETAAEPLLVIDANLRVIAMNSSFAATLDIPDPEKALGLGFGDVLHCRYASDGPDGCGATPYCPSCGALTAITAASHDDKPCERVCALATGGQSRNNDLCLQIRAQSVVLDGRRFILVHARDISQEQLAASCEYDFMHDLSTMLSSVKSYGAFLHHQSPDNELSQRLNQLADRALKEIRLQYMLKHHDQLKAIAAIEPVKLSSIRNLVFSVVLHREVKTGKHIEENGPERDFSIATDPVLVSRVIINMLLNALEATDGGHSVRLTTSANSSRVSWQVWNHAPIPEPVQLRVFQKYFTTRGGHGRGLGTHAMKLLGEEYLGGTVSFTSSRETGTTFTFTLPL
jgi:signal transduction histidine kinase